MTSERLNIEEINKKLHALSNWRVSPNGRALQKNFIFKDFTEAFGFMYQAAIEIEKIDHHPEWSNTYNKVCVNLTTHKDGGITNLDFKLASIMDNIRIS